MPRLSRPDQRTCDRRKHEYVYSQQDVPHNILCL
jgi:hypothetical protein